MPFKEYLQSVESTEPLFVSPFLQEVRGCSRCKEKNWLSCGKLQKTELARTLLHREKAFGSFFFPKKAAEAKYKDRVVVINEDGFIAIGEEDHVKATKMLNEIMATALLSEVQHFRAEPLPQFLKVFSGSLSSHIGG